MLRPVLYRRLPKPRRLFRHCRYQPYSPGSLASAFPWLSNNPDAASQRSRDHPSAGSKPTSTKAASPQTKTKFATYRAVQQGQRLRLEVRNKEQAPPTSSSSPKARLGPNGSQIDSMGRGLGTQLCLRARPPRARICEARQRRTGATTALSGSHGTQHIDEGSDPVSSFSKETAFSRLGRAFRRKSKTGSEMKADIGADLRSAPPLPAVPSNVARAKHQQTSLQIRSPRKRSRQAAAFPTRSHLTARPSMDIDAGGQDSTCHQRLRAEDVAADESRLGESASAMPPPKAQEPEEASTDTGLGQLHHGLGAENG